jgi:hypothetical protein
MSYDILQLHLSRCKSQAADDSPEGSSELVQALEALSEALESDLTQIKAALSHVAGLIEARRDGD